MNTYRMNAAGAGGLYFLGTVFGIGSAVFGGEVVSSIVSNVAISTPDFLATVAQSAPQINVGAFFILMMGLSLVGMTVFLYPLFKRDSAELAMGMVLFRGALEGTYYMISVLGLLTLVALGQQYAAAGGSSDALQAMGQVLYEFQSFLGPVGTIAFLIGATCLYISFYRTELIPRWLSIWGFIGVVPYMAYALLHFFHLDNGIGFYLQMVLAPQELVMGLWLVIKGFDQEAVNRLMG